MAPAAAQRLVEVDQGQRHRFVAGDLLFLVVQQLPLAVEHAEEVHRAGAVLLAGALQGAAVLRHGFAEALLAALVGGVVVHRVVDFLPGTQHGALVVDGGFLLLCLA